MDRSVAAQPLGGMAHDLSLWGLFLQADWVVKLVMVGLLLASVWVWAIIFEKITSIRRANRQADAFERSFWSGGSLDELYQREGGDNSRNPIAAVFGAAVGQHTIDAAYDTLYGAGSNRVSPLTVPRIMPNAPASHVSMEFGLRGPVFAVSSACASANHAIGQALALLRADLADVAVAGGSDASLVLGYIKGWEAMRVLSPDACRPFSRDRAGLVRYVSAALRAGEGAAGGGSSASSSASSSADSDSSRRKGWPTGRRVTGGGAPTAADTSAPSAAPMLRTPTTLTCRPSGSAADRAASR